jgi:hypothetical protein
VCVRDSATVGRVNRDVAAATKLLARGTPTSLINGVRFTGTISQRILDSLVETAIRTRRVGARTSH